MILVSDGFGAIEVLRSMPIYMQGINENHLLFQSLVTPLFASDKENDKFVSVGEITGIKLQLNEEKATDMIERS